MRARFPLCFRNKSLNSCLEAGLLGSIPFFTLSLKNNLIFFYGGKYFGICAKSKIIISEFFLVPGITSSKLTSLHKLLKFIVYAYLEYFVFPVLTISIFAFFGIWSCI